MIQISHLQARRFIRQSFHNALTEGQWNALESHLEGCAECRAYRERRAAAEKALARALRGGWPAGSGQGAQGPRPEFARRLAARSASAITTRETRLDLLRTLAARAAGALALLGLGWLLFLAVRETAPASLQAETQRAGRQAAQATLPPEGVNVVKTTLPEVGPNRYRQVVPAVTLSSAGQGGAPDIFLFTWGVDGMEAANLTDTPAHESDPAWSPDGEWIAFLSDRAGPPGRMDIYRINVAGTRLQRLTADPHLTWRGPLAWSPDGSWLAAEGRPVGAGLEEAAPAEAGAAASVDAAASTDAAAAVQADTGWIYRVGLNAAPPMPLPGTGGGSSPMFSPLNQTLAFIAREGPLGFLRLYHTPTGALLDLTRHEALDSGRGVGGLTGTAEGGPGALTARSFDWAPDGQSILYTAWRSAPFRDPVAVDVRTVVVPVAFAQWGKRDGEENPAQNLASFPSISPVVSVGRTTMGELFYTRTYRRDGEWTSCRLLERQLGSDQDGSRAPLAMPLLCLETGLERAAWGADGQTLLAVARSTTETQTSLYLFHIPLGAELPRVIESMPLIRLPGGSSPPQVRPIRAAYDQIPSIWPGHPESVGPETAEEPHYPDLARVLVTRPIADPRVGSTLARLTAAGSLEELSAAGPAACARISPDGRWIAYSMLSDDADMLRSDLYVMDAQGQQTRRVTLRNTFPDPIGPRFQRPMAGMYGCPAWSPDGTRLAAWMEAAGQVFLAVVPVEGEGPGAPANYYPFAPTGWRAPPVWSADGRRILLFSTLKDTSQGVGWDRAGTLVTVDADTGRPADLLVSETWESAPLAAQSPDGDWLAFLGLELGPTFQAKLNLTITPTGHQPDARQYLAPRLTLEPFEPQQEKMGFLGMAWTSAPDSAGSLGLVYTLLGRSQPSIIYRIPAPERGAVVLLPSYEEITAAAWSPDGRWLLYSTPSGLWLLDLPGASAGIRAPLWVSDVVATELEWGEGD
jgi:Tol biopolymer transport system component